METNHEVTHKLKTWPEFFKKIATKEKNFEVRKKDRDFKVGDILILVEWDPVTEEYTDDYLFRRVTYILEGGQFGIEKGYCVMGLEYPDY